MNEVGIDEFATPPPSYLGERPRRSQMFPVTEDSNATETTHVTRREG